MYGYSDNIKPDLELNKETEVKDNINSLIENVTLEQNLNSEQQPIDTTSTPYIANTDVVCSQVSR